jgi:uncharacterized protein YqjF (DUF2071 family)
VPGIFLTAEWRHLLMLNYVVDPTVLAAHVPAGTEIDLWQGRAYVSVVGFRFLKTRVLGVPIPFHRNFDEVNLRFYVRRQCEGEWRKGVVFMKEIVPRRTIAFVARTFYNENYVRHAMRSTVDLPGRVKYEWKHADAWESLGTTVSGDPSLPHADSEETFISEHYWGYAKQRDGSTVEYGVEHPPWRVWQCENPTLLSQVSKLYGESFAKFLTKPPASAFLAEGSPIIVRRGVRLRNDG